jgi:hypothetical protein
MSDATDGLLAEILAFIDEVNRGDAAAALARFTDDVCIVEDLAPYRMSGPDAGQRWLSAMGANAQRLGVTAVVLHPGQPRRIEARRGDRLLRASGRADPRRPERQAARRRRADDGGAARERPVEVLRDDLGGGRADGELAWTRS